MPSPPRNNLFLSPQLVISSVFFASCGLGLQLDCEGKERILQELVAAHDTAGASSFLGSEVEVDLNIQCAHHLPPLVSAARRGNLPLLAYLLHRGANVNMQAASGTTALMWAALRGDAEMVQVLLTNGADPNIQGPGGDTALTLAVLHRHDPARIIQMLMGGGASVHLRNNEGHTILSPALLRRRSGGRTAAAA